MPDSDNGPDDRRGRAARRHVQEVGMRKRMRGHERGWPDGWRLTKRADRDRPLRAHRSAFPPHARDAAQAVAEERTVDWSHRRARSAAVLRARARAPPEADPVPERRPQPAMRGGESCAATP